MTSNTDDTDDSKRHAAETDGDDDVVFDSSATDNLELPDTVRKTLRTSGLPRELRLPSWPGPTLFSAVTDGTKLVGTWEDGAPLARTGDHEGYVIGEVHDISGSPPVVHSMFVLRRNSGEVWLLDAKNPEDDRFVNSTIEAFLASMNAFVATFPSMIAGPAPGQTALVESFAGLLTKLDARAIERPEHYWPGWVYALEDLAS